MIDLILNYNDDLGYFWDRSGQTFLIEEYELYTAKQAEYKKGKEEGKLEQLNEEYKQLLISKTENLEQVQQIHKNLSQAFGTSIGIIKTLKLNTPKSYLQILKDIYNPKELENSISAKGEVLLNPYIESLAKNFTVSV